MTHLKSNEVIILVHIRKTGGVTLREIINRQYYYTKSYLNNSYNGYIINLEEDVSSFLALSQEEKNKIEVLQGHKVFGFHTYFNKKTAYITMLRNPIERVISDYYHKKTNSLHKEKIGNSSLKDYVQNGVFKDVENFQVRTLSGNLGIPHNSCTREMLNTAIKNIDEQFALAGVFEYYDEFMIMLMLRFGWRYPFYKKLNITHNKPRRTDIDEETIKIIEKYNQLDIELYQYAKAKFENRLKQMDDIFYKKLKTFRKINHYFQITGGIKDYMASTYRKFSGR